MHPAFYIRPARVEEAAALSDLCFRSKAVWGYDPEFMALMLAALGVAGEDIAAGDVWVATGADRQIAGVVALASGGCARCAGLEQAVHRTAPYSQRRRPCAACACDR